MKMDTVPEKQKNQNPNPDIFTESYNMTKLHLKLFVHKEVMH
jgi:hypothetical protein